MSGLFESELQVELNEEPRAAEIGKLVNILSPIALNPKVAWVCAPFVLLTDT